MQIERAQGARIVEHDARAVVEHDRSAREARQRIGGAIQVPVAGHAKMGVQDAPVVEANELMLPPSFDRVNARAPQRAKPRWRQAPPERAMRERDALDPFPHERVPQPADGALDFR